MDFIKINKLQASLQVAIALPRLLNVKARTLSIAPARCIYRKNNVYVQ